MEEDPPWMNFTDMEKLTKFSIRAALGRWLLGASSSDPEIMKLDKYLSLPKWSPLMVDNFLNELATLLLCHKPVASNEFVHLFGPVLIELLERASKTEIQLTSIYDIKKHLLMCCLLGKLSITNNKAVLQFVMFYFQNHPSPFDQTSTEKPPMKKSKIIDEEPISDLDIVCCCYQFVSSAPNYFKSIWNWSEFIKRYHNHADSEVKWLVSQTLAVLGDMSEQEKSILVAQKITPEENRMFSLKYFAECSTIQETTSQTTNRPELLSEVTKEILSETIIDLEGVLLPCFSKAKENTETLVPVPSTRGHLQNLALAITSNLPVLISGPVGCGKTTLVEHVAFLTGRTIQNQGLLKVQLGDQTDAKVLLGTYHSTDVPGEFIWTAGILTQAVREGRWLLLEDINYAPMDVVSMLLPVVESRTLNVPGHGDVIHAAPGFQLFATQRTHNNHSDAGGQSNAATMLKKMWRRLCVEPLSRSELQTVIDVRFPSLSPVADKLLDAYHLLEEHESQLVKFNDRALSSRDFFKWCQRIAAEFRLEKTSILTSTTSQLYVFQDALDCFVACVFNEDRRLMLAEDIGARLNLVKAKAEFYCNSFKPTFNITDESVSIGRVSLSRQIERISPNQATFSWTRNSSVLLERLAICVRQLESVLLVGETGTGKTSSVQYLAQLLGHKLLVINLNQQSDSADLLGGYKPIDLKWKIAPIRQEFESLFQETFSLSQNAKFLSHVSTCFANRRWNDLIRLMSHSQQSAVQRCAAHLRPSWEQLGFKLQQLRLQIRHADSALAFGFVEGSLVKALKQGDWVLLDEINLATAETLECLSGLLESQHGSLFLLERGDREPVERHPNFRLFAAMNPATDVGKKQLPAGLRSRFTEFVVDEITSPSDLATLIGDYLRGLNLTTGQVEGIVRFYLEVRGQALRSLMDGTGRQPHYSLRTLCRALVVASSNPCGTVSRSLYEAFCLSFLTQLDRSSHPLVEKLVVQHVIGKKNLKSVMGQALVQPKPMWNGHTESILVEGYWVPKGDLTAQEPRSYILTDSVKRNLKDLVRVVSLGRLPVLLQGETSVGKTSLINYLAQLTGNKCVRVNNHEHTDLQEYVGSYTADVVTGKLIFREGVLVDAMRQGHWLILDELNLAPSEVLEALNRLLDDNRELFIAETQETVRAHPRFLLFATQNPPGGHYGGRKLLSRAFRNRFVELHFDEIPAPELEVILHKRCDMPLSYCKRLVGVMTELQLRRRGSAAFAGKQGFMTLRDLFRWAERYRLATSSAAKFYDWDQHLADEGYLVLAGRVRKDEEELVIREVLQKLFKRTVDPKRLFTLTEDTSPVTRPILESLQVRQPGFEHIVWTYALRRLVVLVGQALRFVEPVLLVGDTGCGKTSVCQYLATLQDSQLQLMTINCHQYSEGSDFLGGLRPVRTHEEGQADRLFEWVDGPLVLSMTGGHFFLADEISLADDSVLERLNSVLEPERSLLLSEKAGSGEPELVRAHERFRFLSTMNPGGDYGKKELSPALRNRLTEIWAPLSRDRQDIIDIVQHNLTTGDKPHIASSMMDFIEWFSHSDLGRKSTVSIRDILAWVQFINSVQLDPKEAFLHGACLVFLDSLGNRTVIGEALSRLASSMRLDASVVLGKNQSLCAHRNGYFGIEPFFIEIGQRPVGLKNPFTFQAPSTSANLLRLLRGLQLKKPLLLEGSPGVGKTSLVTALAEAAGHGLVRINLSEQTDVSDLFGADLPVEGSETGGRFEWRDGPLLRALKEGHWIVLDELNLASQSVLEGLNAVLDHRGELYIPELGRSFHVRPEMTKLFACQNPLKQGGARKGLPRSFLNRFTQVYIDPLSKEDLEFIARSVHPEIEPRIITKMVEFNEQIVRQVSSGQWGLRGGPWEFNLRDIFRWCEAVRQQKTNQLNPGEFVRLVYSDRMRTGSDREKLLETYETIFGAEYPLPRGRDPHVYVTDSWIQVGSAVLPRVTRTVDDRTVADFSSDVGRGLLILQRNLPALETLMNCIKFNWMTILVGPRASGKTSLVGLAAQLTGHALSVLNTNSAMDTTELLGGFEQGDVNRTLEDLASEVDGLSRLSVRRKMLQSLDDPALIALLQSWETYRRTSVDGQRQVRTTVEEAQHLERRAELLSKVLDLIQDPDLGDLVISVRSQLYRLVQQSNRSVGNNGGGCFEWIDSLLVKALRQGHWLLVDNVNLCSASVLDRLNGLLEPGGVLSLSERGVIDGHIPVVSPHPEFRLFLALDPRHGEISRAMRNRGVEVFLPGSGDDIGDDYSDHDLVSMLSLCGLQSPVMQRTLLIFHQWLCQQLPSGERPTITELVQAASLAAQRLEMFSTIANPLSCLDDTCVEVYIRSIRSPADKEAARLQLSHLLQDAFSHQDSSNVPCLAASAISTSHVQLCSVLARVRQAAILVQLSSKSTDDVQAAVLLLYLTATGQDLNWREEYLKKIAGLDTALYRDVLKEQLAASNNLNASLPWDPRWFESLCRTQFNTHDITEDCDTFSVANRISLALFWTAWMRAGPQNERRNLGRTFGAVSRAIEAGTLAEEAAVDQLLVTVPRFLRQFDQIIHHLLNSPQVKLTNTDWAELMEAVRMRQHMSDVDLLCLEDAEFESSLSVLKQYWSWFLKRSVPVIARLLDRFPVSDFQLPSSQAVDNLLSRRLRRVLDRAEPFANEMQSSVSRLITSILASASLPAVAGSKCGMELIKQISQLFTSSSIDIDKLTQLERELQQVTSPEGESSEPSLSFLPVLSILDHLLLLQHYSESISSSSMITTVPTASSALLQLTSALQFWPEWHLSHWEITNRLTLSRRGELKLPATSPHFSLTAASVLDRNGLVTLGDSVEKRERLQTLGKIFWNNADQLQRPEFDPLINDYKLAVSSLQRLIQGVCHALRIPDVEPGMWGGVGVSTSAAEVTLLALRASSQSADLGSLWLLQGLARCLLLAPGDSVDPVEKRKLKSVLRHREADQTERFLQVHRMYHGILVGGLMTIVTQHPHVRHFGDFKQKLDFELAEESSLKPTWRPPVSLFQQLIKDIRHFVNSVASPQSVLTLHSKLCDFRGGRNDLPLVLSQTELWLNALRNFYQSLKSKYVDYPDLIVSFAVGVGQMIHGAELLSRNVRNTAWKNDFRHLPQDLDSFVADLFDRPSRLAVEEPAGVVALSQLCTSSAVGELFDAVFEDDGERNANKKLLLFSALKDMERYASHARRIDTTAWTSQLAILDALVGSWTAAEERKKQRELEEESLYRSRTIHHEGELSDAEAEKKAIEQFFPSYEDHFTVDDAMDTEDSNKDAAPVDFELTADDMTFICESHVSLLMRWTQSMFINTSVHESAVNQESVAGGFYLRYPLLGRITEVLEPCLSTRTDRRLLGAHLVFMKHVLQLGVPDDHLLSGGKFDFYRDSRVSEAVLCRPVLEHLIVRIRELLAQWPGHAALSDVVQLTERILSFGVDSPLMKLVTGLEMLLTKCHEWETNAHQGVSISEDIQAISKLILRWRTLELDCWKLCLDSVEKQAASSASKYWFHLYSSVTFILNEPHTELEAFQATIRQFMGNSTIGQYDARLRMLGAFTRHVAQAGETGPLLRLLWHALLFYGQLQPLIAKKKASLRQPIEKRVRDFIKIMRWNDINYYALKEAVHKAHSTLHKLMKEWRDVLEQPTRNVLHESGVDVDSAAFAALPVAPFINANRSLHCEFESHPVLSRLPSLYNKSLKLVSEALNKCPFEQRIREVDDLVGVVISSVDQLQKIKVISVGADKEKQKREAKAISMRKRKSLFQLFRTLQQLGISYRKGAFLWKKELSCGAAPLEALETVLPILEVEGSLEHLPQRPTYPLIRQVWNKGHLYYSRCLARLATTASLLDKPSGELGPAVVERLKGFAAQFMTVIQDQWKECSETLSHIVCLRILVSQLAGNSNGVPASSIVISSLQQLWQLVVDALAALEEFDALMKACPNDPTGCQVFQLSGSIAVTPEEASSLLGLRSQVSTKLLGLRRDLEKHFHLFWISSATSWLFNTDQWNCIVDGFKLLEESGNFLDEMGSKAGAKNFGTVLFSLKGRFASAVQEFQVNCQSQPRQITGDSEEIDRLCQSVLHSIQEIYKKHCVVPEEKKEGEEVDEDDFELNHLTGKLMTEVHTDLTKLLKLDATTAELSRSVAAAIEGHQDPKLLMECAPLFEQYVNIVEYYFGLQLSTLRTSSKLLSVLLNVFNQLLEKGFCLPAEMDDSKEGGAGTKFEENESGGLGEGEGAKDVSDQIEDEDQLDTARQKGQEEEESEKDNQKGPKEEENGIEMSEDFDAEAQDLEKKEGDEENESNSEEERNEDELDKQMGETDENAEKLDEKLWGSDEENSDDEEPEEEEGPGDGQKQESQITAKTDQEDDEGTDDKGQDKKKKEKPKPLDENEDEENVNDDQIDPYHTSHDPPPEPEPLDVPEDLNLDGGDAKDKDEGGEDGPEEENPFDIDKIKDDASLNEEETKDEEPKDGGENNVDAEAEEEESNTPFDPKEENPTPGEEEENGGEESKEKEMEEPSEGDNPEPAQPMEEAVPSMDEPSKAEAQPAADQSVKGSQDKTARKDTVENEPEDGGGQNEEAENDETEGVGMAESRQAEGHEGQEQSKVNRKTLQEKDEEAAGKGKPRKPGQSDPNRALADIRKQRVLQVHTTEPKSQKEEDEGPEHDDGAADENNLFEHVRKVDQLHDALAKDAATEEQAKEQLSIIQQEEEKEKEKEEKMEEDIVMKDEDEPDTQPDVDHLEAEKLAQSKRKGQKRGEPHDMEEGTEENPIDIEGEITLTASAQRGPDSSFFTQSDLLAAPETAVSMEMVDQLRTDLEQRLSTWSTTHVDDTEGQETWRKLEMVTSDLAQDLCESLRLILEPSQASRLKGDYRTGKRLNMRKVIPYIASQFRKDRIWLRRTKPAQRNYQIVLAVDDSSSMADNRSKELAFESVALISKALCLLEAGQLGVVSFGEKVQLLHPLHDTFSESSGPRILQQFTFEQKKTKISELVDFVNAMMTQARSSSSSAQFSTAQLMLIVSDGRGLFSEGADCVHQAIRRAKQAGLFMVFVILDNPEGKDSILDIRVPQFDDGGKLLGIKPYLDSFPFPFYVILRDIQTLPVVLSDALRQWFELVTSSSSV